MAYIVTSKNKARAPSREGGLSRTRVYDEQIHAQVLKDQKEVSSQRSWSAKSHDERTRIALDSMKRDAAESCRQSGIEVNSNKLEKVFAEAAELKDKT